MERLRLESGKRICLVFVMLSLSFFHRGKWAFTFLTAKVRRKMLFPFLSCSHAIFMDFISISSSFAGGGLGWFELSWKFARWRWMLCINNILSTCCIVPWWKWAA